MPSPTSPTPRTRPETATPSHVAASDRVQAPPSSSAARRRVLVVAPQPFYEDRGTPIAIRHVLLALSELGYTVDLLTYPVGSSPDIPGVRYHRIPNPLGIRSVPIGFSLRKLWFDLFVFIALRRLLRRADYLFVHAVEEAAILAVLAGRDMGVPIIYDMQSSMPEQLALHTLLGSSVLRPVLRACERWLIRRVDRVVTSAGLAKLVRGAAPHASVHEWHYATIIEPASSTAADDDRLPEVEPRRKLVLYTGNFEDYQGLSLLMTAAPIVLSRVPEATFILVGANWHNTARVARTLKRRLPAGSYQLVPRQPREQIPRFLARADVVVSPRVRGSNLPLKILEYLAAGCAIVATSIPAHKTVLDEGNALLVEPTPDALAEAIITLLRNPARIEELRTAARGYAQRNLCWSSFVQEVQNIYQATEGDGRAETASVGDHTRP